MRILLNLFTELDVYPGGSQTGMIEQSLDTCYDANQDQHPGCTGNVGEVF